VVRGIAEVAASATTDAAGRASLTLNDAQGDYEIVVRKIGWLRGDQFFRAGAGTPSFVILMHRATQTLATVHVDETEDVKHKSYFIDADEIAKHGDVLIDASDILRKLKPDMICGRSCSPAAGMGAQTKAAVRMCPGLALSQPRVCPVDTSLPALATNVWVNGEWIRTIGYEKSSPCQVGRRGVLTGLLPGSMEVLCEILPEHIAQISYVDEFDNTIGKNGSNSALFVVLKAGVKYSPGRKSYVVADTSAVVAARRDTTHAALAAAARAPGDSTALDSVPLLPGYRRRLLGVFDAASGEPVEGARVIELASGTYTTTPASGIVSLVFLPEGVSLLRIVRAGFDDLTLSVEIAATATSPLTLILKKHVSEPGAAPPRG
jgi:hypothetical protein